MLTVRSPISWRAVLGRAGFTLKGMRFLRVLVALGLATVPDMVAGLANGAARLPVLGWNSWCSFGKLKAPPAMELDFDQGRDI